MHYCPESCREFLDDAPIGGDEGGARSFHFRSAPIYLLTLIVGLLFGTDLAIGMLQDAGINDWNHFRELAGFRLMLLAAVLGGARILYVTLDGLFEGKIGADLALTIACLAAIVVGEHSTAALVVFIALCGESIEGYTVDRAQRAIRGAFKLCPDTAHLLTDGRETEVPLQEIQVGNHVVVKPGERIPVDGKIVEGQTAIDQSALTGEGMPVERVEDDTVYAGTVNQFGSIIISATKVGEDTTLAKVVQLVADASDRKSPIERVADRYARLFLPAVLGTAFLTLIGWWIATGSWRAGVLPALSVLVVACPCPLILATPSAVMSAMAWLAKTGVVVKGTDALERLASIDVLAFDKTGTLTTGKMQLASVNSREGLDDTDLLRTAAIAERHSEHPIGRLICREAEARDCVIPGAYEFQALPGTGVTAIVRAADLGAWSYEASSASRIAESPDDRVPLVVGNERLLREQEVHSVDEWIPERTKAETQLFVAANGVLLGRIAVADTIRESATTVVEELRNEGLEFVILSGDVDAAVAQVASTLNIESSAATMLPTDKSEWVTNQTSSGRAVAMVGDGVNDAPALSSATVGIALGGVGTDIAAEAGDLVLMGDPLRPLPGLVRLSRRLVQTIRQSIFLFAFGLNGLGMVLGATGILSPAAAAVFHEIASLAVMFNSLRLLWFERSESSWLGRTTIRLSAWAECVMNALSPTRFVFRVINHAGLLTRFTAAAVALWWFLSNLVLLNPGEKAVVARFGRYIETLEPGLHWRWPAPFETVARMDTDRLRTIAVGYRDDPLSRAPVRDGVETIEWTTSHASHSSEDIKTEAVMLTADEFPVEITAAIQFQITDLRTYVYSSDAPEAVLRAISESSLRETVAGIELGKVLTSGRVTIEQTVSTQIQQLVDRYQLGVKIAAVDLQDVHPPTEIVPAYRQVADALELQEQLKNEAEAYYSRTILSAAGEDAIQSILEQKQRLEPPKNNVAQPQRTTHQANANSDSDTALSDDLWKQLIAEQAAQPMVLSGEAGARILKARHEKFHKLATANASANRFIRIQEKHHSAPFLSRTHLFWETIQQVLANRPLTIVDPKAAGRQHMLLIDPDDLSGRSILPSTLIQPRTADQTDPQTDTVSPAPSPE